MDVELGDTVSCRLRLKVESACFLVDNFDWLKICKYRISVLRWNLFVINNPRAFRNRAILKEALKEASDY